MRIDTKFNIGDKVKVMYTSDDIRGIVVGIEINVYSSGSPRIEYTIFTELNEKVSYKEEDLCKLKDRRINYGNKFRTNE